MTAASPTSSERMIEPELLITGEAVALEITPATVANRIASGLIDYTVYALGAALSVFAVLGLVIGDGSALKEDLALLKALLSLVALAWVVRDDGGTVRLRHCLVRTLLAVVEIWGTWAVPALCASIVSKRGKRFGDMLAGTYVVREHHRSHAAPPLLMPPELVQWAAGTDLRALPGGLSLTARTFLQRASSLVPSSRHQLGLELASQVQGYVSPPPPAGTHPERFLAAVLTERRNRELVLESRNRRLEEDVLRDMARPPYGVGGGETRRR